MHNHNRAMRNLLILTVCCVTIFSCGGSPKKAEYRSFDLLEKEFIEVAIDSATSWEQVTALAYPFADSLREAALDENNTRRRIKAQRSGYLTIELLSEKYTHLSDSGREVNQEDVSNNFGKFSDQLMEWFLSDEEEMPHLFRDHYYVSHKDSEKRTEGYFHLMATLPTESVPEPALHIFYPESAEDYPHVFFTDYEEGVEVDDVDSLVEAELVNWSPKDSVEEGYPMYAVTAPSAVQMMLQYDTMFLMFKSGPSADGSSDEIETARVPLEPFQKLWKESVR